MQKHRGFNRTLLNVLGLLTIGLLAGCGGGSDGGGGTSAPGIVSVSLTDAPACGYDQVNVTVSQVRIHQSSNAENGDGGWTNITLSQPRTINLLDLNDPTASPKFALEQLGETSLPAGHYTQLRLMLVHNTNNNNPDSNWVVLTNDSTKKKIPLDTSSEHQGIKLINQFTVNSGERVDLLLDFDACHSIVVTGNGKYKLKPVIKVIPYVLNGIEGYVRTALLGSNVVVSAQSQGAIARATVPNPTTGKFFLAHLPWGVDVKYDVVITADNHATAVITGVPVTTSNGITVVSTNATPTAPIDLASSPSQNINGTVTLQNPSEDDATVIVRAKQTLNGPSSSIGPTITVKSQVAALLPDPGTTGDYKYGETTPATEPFMLPFALPTGPPWLGQYSNTLPISLSATVPDQAGVAKMYTIRGTAQSATTTYNTQSPTATAVDITATPTQNFTLAP